MAAHDSWRMQLPPLRKHGMNILSHDFIGQLKSSKLKDTYSLKNHVDDFIELMDHLKIDKIHLVGTSYGGEVAQRFAIDHPDRLKTLTLIDTLSEIDSMMKYGGEH